MNGKHGEKKFIHIDFMIMHRLKSAFQQFLRKQKGIGWGKLKVLGINSCRLLSNIEHVGFK